MISTHLGYRWFLRMLIGSSHTRSRCSSRCTSLCCGRGCWSRCSSRGSRSSPPASSSPSPPGRSSRRWWSESWCSPGSLSAGTLCPLRRGRPLVTTNARRLRKEASLMTLLAWFPLRLMRIYDIEHLLHSSVNPGRLCRHVRMSSLKTTT